MRAVSVSFSLSGRVIDSLRQDAKQSGQRRLLVVSGRPSWCYLIAQQAEALFDGKDILWVGETGGKITPGVTVKQASRWLGKEINLLIFDGFSGIHPDALGLLSGTVKAGGLMLLLLPDIADLPDFNDPAHRLMAVYPTLPESVNGRYLKRLAGLIRQSKELSLICEGQAVRLQDPCIENNLSIEALEKEEPEGCITKEQVLAVEAVQRVVKGHRRRPLVLTADRGRGKSASLGIAAARLMKEREIMIRVTAPSYGAVATLFHHAAQILDVKDVSPSEMDWQQSRLAFTAPDALLQENKSADLLLVDEAAAIPEPLLEQILMRYARVVFSSTVHGYEGTGRGFAVRFFKTLDQRTPQWRRLHLEEPVRWAAGDPLEAFIFKALLLNAEPVNEHYLEDYCSDQAVFEVVDRDSLAEDETLLAEIFGLLVLAHYQTRPADLRYLLDGPNIRVFLWRYHQHVVAAVLVALEGNIEAPLSEAIYQGKRRVRGHLLPQSIAHHIGISQAPLLMGGRIMRIAVHPILQRQGVGSCLLSHVVHYLTTKNMDYVGSLFGATPDLLGFWGKNQFQVIRIGINRDAASGTYSAMVMKPLSGKGQDLFCQAHDHFRENFPWLLPESLQSLNSYLVIFLLRQSGAPSFVRVTNEDRQAVKAFVDGYRQYENVIASVKHIVFAVLTDQKNYVSDNKSDRSVLVWKVIQNMTWHQVAEKGGFSGYASAVKAVRNACAELF
ncbi:tRNA(Met) cytidine acetyltransferase TmcA [invertebrate metagenome]|uniref:tRNA(Met) cytidine acetyltransferase TmcA n=1 Tax=invertebrate metagenome TaxID=1711999 RepID=A0A2H9T6A5_9ZZZZ